MSWIKAITRFGGSIAIGILAFIISIHAMYSWGLSLRELNYLAVVLAVMALVGEYLPARIRPGRTRVEEPR